MGLSGRADGCLSALVYLEFDRGFNNIYFSIPTKTRNESPSCDKMVYKNAKQVAAVKSIKLFQHKETNYLFIFFLE